MVGVGEESSAYTVSGECGSETLIFCVYHKKAWGERGGRNESK